VLDCGFVCILCMAMPLCLWCRIVVGFPWFSSCLLLGLAFIVLRVLGIGWGRRKLMELKESCLVPER